MGFIYGLYLWALYIGFIYGLYFDGLYLWALFMGFIFTFNVIKSATLQYYMKP